MLGQVAIPSGAVYPDGLPITSANPDIQASVRPEGAYFAKSVGYETIRPGNSKFQHNKGMGIHFTPMRFAEDVSRPNELPVLVDISTAPDHVDIANLPGSERLGPGGTADVRDRVLMGESVKAAPVGGAVAHRGTKTLPDMGDREPHRPLSQMFHGLSDPVELFRAEYAKNPLVAVLAAAGITGLAYMIARDFERSYRRRNASASSGGGIASTAAPVAAAPAAATDTSGNVVEKAADTVAEVIEETGEAVEQATEAVADAVTE